jgi:hypothetical protein
LDFDYTDCAGSPQSYYNSTAGFFTHTVCAQVDTVSATIFSSGPTNVGSCSGDPSPTPPPVTPPPVGTPPPAIACYNYTLGADETSPGIWELDFDYTACNGTPQSYYNSGAGFFSDTVCAQVDSVVPTIFSSGPTAGASC